MTPESSDEVVHLRPYTIIWAWLFRLEWILLRTCLGRRIMDIQHIGSTAIPGMIAKPIIDINLAVANYEQAASCIPLIKQAGYEYKGESSKRREYHFVKRFPMRYHLYVVEAGSEAWTARLCFRDYLVRHPETARAYTDLKRQLAKRFTTNLEAYQAGKLGFAQQVLEMATPKDRT